MFFEVLGGKSRDPITGEVFQSKLWWPMLLGSWVDSVFRTLAGKGVIGIPSTGILIRRSMNTHTPVDQKISLQFVDAENPKRLIWGMELSADNARKVAMDLISMAENADPTGLMENAARIAKQLEGVM